MVSKILSVRLYLKLIEYKPKIIYLIFDPDAKKEIIELSLKLQSLLQDSKIYTIFLEDGDPNELGHNKIWQLINDCKYEVSWTDKLKNKLN